jgi:hypothetical protein
MFKFNRIKLNHMKTKFLSVCIGIGIVLFSSGFFIQSISPATAQTNVGNTNSDCKTGRYQMQLSSFVFSSAVYYRILVWDTETGKSKQYVSSSGSSAWTLDDENLPGNPMN